MALKKLVILILLFSFFWQALFQSAFLGYWKWNQGEIIATKCINRFKPMMHCNGKCYLYRELKKAADEEAANNKIPQAVLKLKTIDSCIITDKWQWNAMTFVQLSQKTRHPNHPLLEGFSSSLIRPPQTLV